MADIDDLIGEMQSLFQGLTQSIENLQNTNSRLASRMGAGPEGTADDFLTDTSRSIREGETIADYFANSMDETLKNRFNEFRMKQDLDAFGASFGSMLLNFNKDFSSSISTMMSGIKSFGKTIQSSFVASFKNKDAPLVQMEEALNKAYESQIRAAGSFEKFRQNAMAGGLGNQAKLDIEAYNKTFEAAVGQFSLSIVGAIQSGFKQAVSAFAKEFTTKLIELNMSVFDFRRELEKSLGVTEDFSAVAMQSFENVRKRGIAIADFSAGVKALKNNFTDFTMETVANQAILKENAAILNANGYSAETFAKGTQLMTKSLNMSAPAIAQTQRELFAFGMDIGVSPDVLAGQFDQARDSIAKLGDQGVKSFQRLAVAAKVTGMEVSRILNLTDQFDTFEGAAEMTGKLNAALGGNFVNAMDLMMAKDPVARFEMIRDSIKGAGLSFDEMSYFQKNFFKDSLGLQDISELSLLMSGNMDSLNDQFGKTSAEYEVLAKRAQELASFQEFLNNIFYNLIPIVKPLIERMYEFTKSMSKPENMEKFRKVIAGIGMALSVVLVALSTLIMFIPGMQAFGAVGYSSAAGIAALVAGVTGLGTAFAGVTTATAMASGESDDLTRIFDALSEALDQILDSMPLSSALFGSFAESVAEGGSALEYVIFAIQGVGTLISVFVHIIDLIAAFAGGVAYLVGGLFSLVGILNQIGGNGSLLDVVATAFKFLGAVVLTVIAVMTGPVWGTIAAAVGAVVLALSFLHDILFKPNSPILWDTLMSFGKAVAKSFMNLNPVTGVLMTLVDSLTLVKDTIFAVRDSFAMLLELAATDLTPVVTAFQEMGSSMESVKNLPVEKIQALTTGGVARGGQVQQIVEREVIRDVKFVIGDREFKEVVDPIADARFNKLSTSFIV